MRLSLSLPDIVRVCSVTEESAVAHIVSELSSNSGGFNYIDATKRVKSAYKGLHTLDQLLQTVRREKPIIGQSFNLDVVKLAAPFAFGRNTNVFDLHSRSFQYAEGRQASYRAPFFFAENGVIKLLYLQPRKGAPLTVRQASLYGSIVKKYLLDSEFYGEKTDIEILDVAERRKGEGRSLQAFNFSNLEIWEDDKIAAHIGTVRTALEFVENQNLVSRKRRPLRDPELPLFF